MKNKKKKRFLFLFIIKLSFTITVTWTFIILFSILCFFSGALPCFLRDMIWTKEGHS